VTFHKILCPIDFSPGSQQAMKVAVHLAGESSAELLLAHAWYLPPLAFAGESPFPGDTLQLMVEDEEQGLAAARREAVALGAKRVDTVFLSGVPWDRIVDTVLGDRAIDLVVMGTHGRTGLGRILLGSVAEKVVRHAPCSVLVTRGEATSFKRVLCPVDFSDDSKHAIDIAAEFAKRSGATITLCHVVEVPITYSGEPLISDFLGDLEKRSTQRLQQAADELRAKVPVAVTTRTTIGSPGGELLEILDKDPTFDLVVMGSHGRTGIRRVLLGSVAEKLVRHAACPVFVARNRHA
jgi:nucleotide-binding universal stress UspA family protein